MVRRALSWRPLTRTLLVAGGFVLLFISNAHAAERSDGYFKRVAIKSQGTIDGVFPLANQSPAEPPQDWLPEYDATKQAFEMFIPAHSEALAGGWPGLPLILFISPGDAPQGWPQLAKLCQEKTVCFASPYDAGNDCSGPRRVRIVLDMLEQLHRNYKIDPDRTYIAGFSGGGRIAQQIAAALPEYFGGAIPICAAELPRAESWLRERMASRLSIALITGETDFNRGEVERWKGPILADVGVRSRVWVVPKMGHGVPDAKVMAEAFDWLDEGADDRRKLAKQWPASHSRLIQFAGVPTRSAQADALQAEAWKRLEQPATLYSGLMQLKGIAARWPDLPQAEAATRKLVEYELRDDRSWAEADIAEQRTYLVAEARGLTAYLTGPLPQQYQALKPRMATAALSMWQLILDDGQDAQAVAEAKKWIPELKNLVGN